MAEIQVHSLVCVILGCSGDTSQTTNQANHNQQMVRKLVEQRQPQTTGCA